MLLGLGDIERPVYPRSAIKAMQALPLIFGSIRSGLRDMRAAREEGEETKAAVPRTEYRSVFKDTPTGVEQETADWKKANASVGQFLRGHIDLLKWEEQNQSKPNPAPASALPSQEAMKKVAPSAPNPHKH